MSHQVPWNRWWIAGWLLLVTGMTAGMVARAPFVVWAPVAGGLFGGMEGYGLVDRYDAFPPLTEVCREYLPRWATLLAVGALLGLGTGTWMAPHDRWWLGFVGGLGGWLLAHFDVTYDDAPPLPGPQ